MKPSGPTSEPLQDLGTQALIQPTDLGMAWKTGTTQLQAFIFSYNTAQPVTNARVQLFSDENELLQESHHAAGLASLPLTNAEWLAVQQGQDLHALEALGGQHSALAVWPAYPLA